MSRKEDFKKAADDYVKGEPDGAQKIVGQVGFEFGAEYGYQYAQTHPNWIKIEDGLPPHRNQTTHKFENDFSVNCFVSDGKDIDIGYYDYRLHKWNCEFLSNVVYWYRPQSPRKEDKK
jgi:hypothetical protein